MAADISMITLDLMLREFLETPCIWHVQTLMLTMASDILGYGAY
ncbi:MAG: hypothetical protein AB2693_32790 [Candidatus Thiodiazotropha sp.]